MNVRRERVHETEAFQGKWRPKQAGLGWGVAGGGAGGRGDRVSGSAHRWRRGSSPGRYGSSRGYMLPKFGEVLGLKSPFAAEMLLLQACSRSPPSHTRSCVLADSDAWLALAEDADGSAHAHRAASASLAPPAASPSSAGPASLCDGLAFSFLPRTLTFENKCPSSPWGARALRLPVARPPCPVLSRRNSRKLRGHVGFQTLWRVVSARRCPSGGL